MINSFEDNRIKELEGTVYQLQGQVAELLLMVHTCSARLDELECKDVASVDKIREAFRHAINYL